MYVYCKSFYGHSTNDSFYRVTYKTSNLFNQNIRTLCLKKKKNRNFSYINLDFLQFFVLSHYTTYTFYRYTCITSLKKKLKKLFQKLSKVVFIYM